MISIQNDFSLLPYNTFGMEVYAAHFSIVKEKDQLPAIIKHELFKKGTFILGGGSNILFTRDVNEWVIYNQITGIEKIKEDEDHVWLKAGAGEVWHRFVMYCIEHDYAGVENLALIPGSVGAAPIQNIGAYGVEVKNVIEKVDFFDFKDSRFIEFNNEECKFAYRNSIFKNEWKGRGVITSVVFKLNKKSDFNIKYGQIQEELSKMQIVKLTIRHIANAVINIRSSKLPNPKEIGNAGSFFKNPEISKIFFDKIQQNFTDIPFYKVGNNLFKIPAAWLIEHCGWKGFRNEDYGVHKNQALVLVNYANAAGSDIAKLSEGIMKSVKSKFNIDLEREVQIY